MPQPNATPFETIDAIRAALDETPRATAEALGIRFGVSRAFASLIKAKHYPEGYAKELKRRAEAAGIERAERPARRIFMRPQDMRAGR